jgi:hypothetical protein
MIKYINKFLCSGSVLISGLFYPRERENPRQTIASGHIPVKQLADSNGFQYIAARQAFAFELHDLARRQVAKADWTVTIFPSCLQSRCIHGFDRVFEQ